MCGIAGILNLDGRPAEIEEVGPITRALAHRGPDGEGMLLDGPVGLGHRRLAILDLSDSGEQPMRCVDGRYVVTFNGEIFNFLELRRELEALGHRFRSDTDTEVIGAAYHEWGHDCVLRFNGMWAFALWDTERRVLFLSRDRFGIKPLFFMAEPRRVVFASELKSFLQLRDFTARENEDVMRLALFDAGAFELVPDTLLQGVKRLQSGHNMLVSQSSRKTWRWWNTLDHVPAVPATLSAQAAEFRELFFDACRVRLRSDVPVATCLSGGVDSSAVLSTLAALRGARGARGGERVAADYQRAFVATFPGTRKDERRFADIAVRHTRADARYRPMSVEPAIESLYRYAYDFENVGGSLMIPLWRVYRELRRDGVVVSLDGHGGDEVLAGYRHYVQDALTDTSIPRSPLRTLDLIRTLQPMNGPGPPSHTDLLRERLRRSPALDFVRPWVRRIRGSRPPLPRSDTWAASGPVQEGLERAQAERRAACEHLGSLNGALYAAVHLDHLPHILRNFERCSMAHGVEVRMPFLDWRLVCFAFGLPETSKIGGGYTKRVLREAMRGVMPEALRTRKDKIGFSPPMNDWFAGGLGDWVRDEVHTDSFLESTVWDGPAIRDFVDARPTAGSWRADEYERVWPFLQAHLWRQTFFERRPTLAGATTGWEA